MKITFTPNKLGKATLLTAIVLIAVLLFKKRTTLKSITVKTINYLKQKTWDIVSDRRIESLHPSIKSKTKEFIIKAYKLYGIKLRVTSALRTREAQTQLYAKGRTSPGKKVTNAKAGQSYHNYGLAFDVVEIKNGKALWNNPNWNKIGALGKSLGFTWGGDWKFTDKPHFQMTFGKHHRELAQLYKQGKRNGNYITLT